MLCLFSLAFIVVALARPQWGTHEEVAHMTGLDVVVALDVSNSMETEDVVPSRLKKAKHLIRNVVDHLAGDRVGLIAFAGSAYLACPLTTDLDYVLESLTIQSPLIIANQGTDISLALQTAYTALDRGAVEPDTHAGQVPIASRAVILVTDGEDHEGGMEEIAEKLKVAGIKLYILGVGTERGGPVPLRNEEGQLQGYKRDSRGQPVVSSFKPKQMLKLAAAAGGHYWNASESEDEVTALLKDLGTLGRADLAEHRYLVYEERFQYPLAIAILLLLLELSLSTRKNRSRVDASRAVKATLLIAAFALGANGRVATASPLDTTDTYLENKKGVEAYANGKLDEAKQHFSAAQARSPSKSELFYNQGVVELGTGDTDSAIRSFSEAAHGGMTSGNPELLGKSLFNLGSAFTKKGDTRNALRSYLGAIQAAKATHDAKLEADARKNVELLGEQQKKQKQQQKPDQKQDQKQDQKKDQQQDQKQDQQQSKNDSDQDKKESQDKKEGDQKDSSQPPRYEDHPKEEKFNSKKLTRDDAERVFSELNNRELDLQVKQRKENANRNNNHEDW